MNRIHTEEIDLFEFKELNDLPTWYPIHEIPYTIQARVSLTPDTVTLQLTYISKSKDPDFFLAKYKMMTMGTNFSISTLHLQQQQLQDILLSQDKKCLQGLHQSPLYCLSSTSSKFNFNF